MHLRVLIPGKMKIAYFQHFPCQSKTHLYRCVYFCDLQNYECFKELQLGNSAIFFLIIIQLILTGCLLYIRRQARCWDNKAMQKRWQNLPLTSNCLQSSAALAYRTFCRDGNVPCLRAQCSSHEPQVIIKYLSVANATEEWNF